MPDHEKEDGEDEQDHEEKDADVEEELVHLGQFPRTPEERGLTRGDGERVGHCPVGCVGRQDWQKQVSGHFSSEVVEVAACDPPGDRHQRVDHLYLREVQARRHLPQGCNTPGEIRDDVVA
jgi:hypothetical protein